MGIDSWGDKAHREQTLEKSLQLVGGQILSCGYFPEEIAANRRDKCGQTWTNFSEL